MNESTSKRAPREGGGTTLPPLVAGIGGGQAQVRASDSRARQIPDTTTDFFFPGFHRAAAAGNITLSGVAEIDGRGVLKLTNETTCFYPSQAAEDFILLLETTPLDQISRPSRRRLRKYPIIPEFCAAKSSTGDNNAAAAVFVPGSRHRKRSRDAIGDDLLSGDRFSATHDPRKMTKASPSRGHESEIDPLISQHRGMHSRNKKAMELIAKGWSALKEVDRVIDYCELNDRRLIPLLRVSPLLRDRWSLRLCDLASLFSCL
ncbi:uncharacterized protein LOC130136780 [Syzygium oleosum]|uniref:uncharacterized protein LOC130136780 n=1 Tax=Syzygium oleosum TaxID=219896 RepID=UPI0024BA464D|nr:uncharacterized protein LOC130136780 [Syzygium oleosum]